VLDALLGPDAAGGAQAPCCSPNEADRSRDAGRRWKFIVSGIVLATAVGVAAARLTAGPAENPPGAARTASPQAAATRQVDFWFVAFPAPNAETADELDRVVESVAMKVRAKGVRVEVRRVDPEAADWQAMMQRYHVQSVPAVVAIGTDPTRAGIVQGTVTEALLCCLTDRWDPL